MVYVSTEQISSLFVGEMGVKRALVGEEQIYERSGSYVYIQLIHSEKTKGDETSWHPILT
jgi:hypothetical protein